MKNAAALRRFACLFFLLIAVRGAQATGGDLIWEDRLDIDGGGEVAGDVAGYGNRLFVVGGTLSAAGDVDGLVRAYDARTGLVLWQDRFDFAAFDNVTAVTVNGSRVFISGYSGPFDSLDFLVRAYDGMTGELLWQDKRDVEGNMDFAVAVAAHAGRVFAVGSFLSADGNDVGLVVRAYDERSGAALWEDLRLGETFGATFVRPLAVAGNRLYITTVEAPGTGFVVRAYDAATGATLWEDHHIDVGYATSFALTTAGGRVFVVGADGSPTVSANFLIRAYDARNGTLLWQDQGSEVVPGSAQAVATTGGVVFAGGWIDSEEGLVSLVRAYDANTGALLWEHGTVGGGITVLAAQGNRLVVADSDDGDFVVRTYDARTGEVEWEDRHDVAGSSDFALAVVANGSRVFAVGGGITAAGDSDFLVRAYAVR